ncbi:hypothetical protein SDC9_106343 [bioreactor metagenome]|uniref:Uncharacterized protein n=1 Tax=bioreactor metagenome TaxID=1076179 RepID=A0A645B264_9ZZZZ
MRSALCRVLAVNKSVVFFAVLVGMSNSYFNIFTVKVDNGIKDFGGQVVVEQVFEPVFRIEFLTVKSNRQPRIQENIIFKQRLNMLLTINIVSKNFRIGSKFNNRSVVL